LKHHHSILRTFSLCSCLLLPALGRAADTDLAQVSSNVVTQAKGFWHDCTMEPPAATVTSRDLFAYAFALAESGQHPERLDRLFTLAERMQDRDPHSKSYGNFWWSMRDGKVMDYNAVDFSMRNGALLWLKHQDFVPASLRPRLQQLLEFAVRGCLGHQVPSSYSNIAIMNAADLIVLGEVLGKPDVAQEGYARLDAFYRYTQSAGVHEYDSPTYTAVDLNGLEMVDAFAQRPAGRAQARALLTLFWTDIALNWLPFAEKLGGAQSRTYDYLYGLGDLDRQLAWTGWLNAPPSTGIDFPMAAQGRWHPPESLRGRSAEFPRLVRQSWGADWWQARTHYVLADVSLGSAAAGYGGRMDMPLTVDLPGARKSVRGYFIADGRNDPYGQIKLAAGAHQKAFHLDPFWTAAQRNGDALGLAIYREKDIARPELTTLVSDFVLPLDADSFWIGGRRVEISKAAPVRLPVAPGEMVALRKGGAALGLRVPWSRGLDGRAAKIFLIYDGNKFGAVRLAVEHVDAGVQPKFNGVHAGAAFWVRIGSGLQDDADFARWRDQFAAADATAEAKDGGIKLKVAGVDGEVSLAARSPWTSPETLVPAPTRSPLELNGTDLAGKILATGQ
jgi:hypothetical protein